MEPEKNFSLSDLKTQKYWVKLWNFIAPAFHWRNLLQCALILILVQLAVTLAGSSTTLKEDAMLKAVPYLTEWQKQILEENNGTGVPIPGDCGYWGVSGAWHPYQNCTIELRAADSNSSPTYQPWEEEKPNNCAEAVGCASCLASKYGFGSYFNPCELCAHVWMGMFWEGCDCCQKIGG